MHVHSSLIISFVDYMLDYNSFLLFFELESYSVAQADLLFKYTVHAALELMVTVLPQCSAAPPAKCWVCR